MIIISREKAHSCTDQERSSLLRQLFNALADSRLDDVRRRSCHGSILEIKRAQHPRCGR